jgi:hypothetical protein
MLLVITIALAFLLAALIARAVSKPTTIEEPKKTYDYLCSNDSIVVEKIALVTPEPVAELVVKPVAEPVKESKPVAKGKTSVKQAEQAKPQTSVSKPVSKEKKTPTTKATKKTK